MSGMMRPVGPESAETYWLRRALVVGVMLVLLIIVLIVLFNLGGSPGQAAPAPATSAVPAGGSSPGTTSPGAGPTNAASTSARPSTSATPTAASSTTTSSKPTASATASTRASTKPTTSTKPTSSAKPSARHTSSKPSASKKPSSPAAAACTKKQLWPALKASKHTVAVGSRVSFDVSYINRSDQACSVKINDHSYQLTIYSGTDRIWSSGDCPKVVRATTSTLKPGQALTWTVSWNGKRSDQHKSCANRPETPRPGYYHATSKLNGAKGLQETLILT